MENRTASKEIDKLTGIAVFYDLSLPHLQVSLSSYSFFLVSLLNQNFSIQSIQLSPILHSLFKIGHPSFPSPPSSSSSSSTSFHHHNWPPDDWWHYFKIPSCFSSSMFSTPFVLIFSLLLSIPILFLLAPHILPPRQTVPIPPQDEIDDLALFRRAATDSLRHSHLSSSNPKLKIAFLFLTNSDLYFAPFWERFFPSNHELYNIYIHADPSINITNPRGVFDNRFVAAKRTFRASPTLISATRRLIAYALLDDPTNGFFAVLSQYCIPLHSFRYVYESIVSSQSFDSSTDESDTGLTQYGVRIRYRSFIETISDEPRLWKRYIARGRYAMLPEIPFDEFRVGSQFFVLTRRHALTVIKDRALWKKFKLPCYRADECFPEEHYFPTLLSMKDPDGCTHYTLTRVNWTGTTNGHPYTYSPKEISAELIQGLRISNHSSSYLFARKFSPECLTPLLKIAKSIFRD